MTRSSTDLFSKQADLYSLYRPVYPQGLFECLADLAPSRTLAWDCATGNGQAAQGLSPYFDRILATDLSAAQIQNALNIPNVEYLELAAEQPLSVESHSVDLVTVAQAIHWFDHESFYREVKRVLKPGGIFAAWGYGFHAPISPEIDSILREFYFDTLGPFWKPQNQLIWDRYVNLNFPFEEIQLPEFRMEVAYTLEEFLGYFKTWSASALYREKNGVDATESLRPRLERVWGDLTSRKPMAWDLILKVGRHSPEPCHSRS